MARTPYVSIDIETTGLDPSWCQVLEFGAVIEDWTTPVEQLPSFHCYVVHDRIVGDPFALAMNAEILRRIANRDKDGYREKYTYYHETQVGLKFAEWLLSQGIDTQHVQPAGKNFASFDKSFLAELGDFIHRIHFKHRTIDPGSMFWNPDEDSCVPDTKTCMKRAGISGDVAHTAVEDAIKVIEMVRFAKHPNLWTSRDLVQGVLESAIHSQDRSPFPGGPGKLGL